MVSPPAHSQVSDLLGSAGLPRDLTLTPLTGGGNNRVYRVDAGLAAYLLKSYFKHPGDQRDRLNAEFSFVKFAWDQGIRSIPRPYARDVPNSLGLYEFIDGSLIAPERLDRYHVEAAADFFRSLNEHRQSPAAISLGAASEACFTSAEHVETVDRRMARLTQIDAASPAGQEAQALVAEELTPAWERIRREAIRSLPAGPADADRCLSPSDFGFHNALERGGKPVFLDFEYAGWDDPAKAICDFFCQPAVPVPQAYFNTIARAFTAHCTDPAAQIARARLLLPVYRVKWCCIMLNEFLPVDSQRRLFARDPERAEERKRRQLTKVKDAISRLVE